MQYKKLGEIASFTRGLTYSKNDESSCETDKRVLRSNNIDLDTHAIVFDEIKYLNSDFVIQEDKKLHKGDLFICMSNGSKQHLGKVAYVSEDLDYAFGGFMGAITPYASINSKYLYYYCISNKYKSLLLSIGKGANINNIKFSELSDFPVPVPSLAAQSRIVSELDLLTSLIDNQKKQLDELSKLQQSTFYSMFGDPVENEKKWPVKKLGEVCEFKNGINFNKVDNGGNEYTFLGVSDFKDNVCIYSEQLGVINIEEKITDDYFLENNDIVFVRSNGSKDLVGRAVLIKVGNEKVTYSGFCIRCRIVSDNNSLFLIWLLKYPTIKDCLTNAGRGCNISNVNQKVLNNLLIPLPPLPLQTAFAEKISAIEEMKKSLKASIAETQKMFDARMQEIFG